MVDGLMHITPPEKKAGTAVRKQGSPEQEIESGAV